MDRKTKKSMLEALKIIIAIIVLIVGVVAAIYYGGYVMFIKAILSACAAFDAGTLTATIVGLTVIKCLFASTVAGLIISVTCGVVKFLCK